jgi:predicted dienelactone hydrolase
LAAPALGYAYVPESLRALDLPVELWVAERDEVLERSVHAAPLHEVLPQSTIMTVPGAGHYAFLPLCPPSMAQELPEICTDPEGFEREAFNVAFNNQVVAHFRATLGGAE